MRKLEDFYDARTRKKRRQKGNEAIRTSQDRILTTQSDLGQIWLPPIKSIFLLEVSSQLSRVPLELESLEVAHGMQSEKNIQTPLKLTDSHCFQLVKVTFKIF